MQAFLFGKFRFFSSFFFTGIEKASAVPERAGAALVYVKEMGWETGRGQSLADSRLFSMSWRTSATEPSMP